MVYVQRRLTRVDRPDNRYVIGLKKDGTENSLEIIRMVADSEMYRNGLEKHREKLVDMSSITESLQELLQAYININFLNEADWKHIISVYRPFIDISLKFEYVDAFLKDPEHKGAWE